MKKTVLERLKGGLIGCLIGEQLSYSSNIFQGDKFPKIHLAVWSQLQWQIIENLIINYGCGFKEEIKDKINNLEQLNSSPKLALATLGLNFYCHESLTLWQEQLQQIAPEDEQFKSMKLDLMIYAQAINLILTEKVKPQFFLEQLLEKISQFQTPLTEKLILINQAQKKVESSTTIIKKIQSVSPVENDPLAMAIYYFSDTMENIEISLTRAKQCSINPLITTSLTGSLAGLYHGWYGLPLQWRLMIKQQAVYSTCEHLCQQLFLLWAGAYDPQNLSTHHFNSSIPVALPQIIQSRHS